MSSSVSRIGTPASLGLVNSLCTLWQALCDDPSEGALRDAKERAVELSNHVDECPRCVERRPAREGFLPRIYEALAGSAAGTNPVQEDLLRLRADVEAETRHAVENVLYPQLPPRLEESARAWDALAVYRAVDALAMLVERETRGRQRTATLSKTGLLVAGVPARVDKALLVREVRKLSRVDDSSAEALFEWSLEAARNVPRLFPGIDATPAGADALTLRVQARPVQLDLTVQWAPR